jgi:hypothetical protein
MWEQICGASRSCPVRQWRQNGGGGRLVAVEHPAIRTRIVGGSPAGRTVGAAGANDRFRAVLRREVGDVLAFRGALSGPQWDL